MKGIVLEDIRSGYFTNMKDVFDAINNLQTGYNWLITDYECNDYPSDYISYNQKYVWINGEKLTEIITNYEIQFIWGGFSAFNKNISSEEVVQFQLPFADGNRGLWDINLNIQHPLADIEIVCWDSSVLLVISKQEDIITQFEKVYPQAKDLEKYNAM